MSKFGQILFAGGGFIRWALSPFVLLFAVLMPLLIEEWTLDRTVLMVVMELMCFCLLAGFWLPPRIGFLAFRFLAGMVAVAYAAYLVHEFFFTDKPFTVSGRRSNASPFGAILGFLFIGVPSLLFAVLGRFSLRPPRELAPDDRIIESDDDDA
jgi:cyanate permease